MEHNSSLTSMESIMEFGVGMALAQQMAAMINRTCAGSITPPPVTDNGGYYLAINGKVAGPFTDDELVTLVKNKTLLPATLVWQQGMSAWKRAEGLPNLQRVLLLARAAGESY